MLPMRFFRSRAFAASNGVSLAMYFGVFGSIFLLAQFFQVVQGTLAARGGPAHAAVDGMPMLVAPIAGLLSDRIGSRPLMVAGLALQAVAIGWLASVSTPDVAYSSLVLPFILAGTGMALVFAPDGQRGARRGPARGGGPGARRDERDPRGRRRARRRRARLGVRGHGSYASPQAFIDGMTSAAWVGAAVLAVGRAARPARARQARRAEAQETAEPGLVAAS